jgi:type I restriction enzyme S subunit
VTRGASPRPIIEWIAPTGTPWIKISDATAVRSRTVDRTREFIRPEGERYSVRVVPGDLIVSNSATPGIPKFVGLNACIHDGWLLLRDFREVLPEYLYYRVLLDREQLVGQGNGSVFTNLKTDILKSHTIQLPPIEEQRGIAATLGALDDKIESNRRVVDLVPRLIRAFVGQALDGVTLQIPAANLARFVNGGAYTKGAAGTGRMVIRIAELNSGAGGSTVYSEIDVPEEKTARPGDLLMSWSGSLGVYRWVLDEAIINQHIFKVIPSDGYPTWLVFDRLDQVMSVFQGIAKDKATTMGHIQRGHLESTTVSVPSQPTVAALDDQLAPLWDRLLLAERENVILAALRDTLLPELLSGRIRVPEARDALAENCGLCLA